MELYNSDDKINKFSWDLIDCLLFGFQLENLSEEFVILNYILMMTKNIYEKNSK